MNPRELVPVLDGMFDKLGGLGRLVKGKTVAIKLNFNGGPPSASGICRWAILTGPIRTCVGATMHLMARAGVHRCAWWSARRCAADRSL